MALERFGIDPSSANEETLKLARSYAEQQRFAGRLTSEVGELRQLLDGEESALWVAEEHASAEPQPRTGNVLLDDPATALDVALQTGNTEAVPIVWQAWNERDPAAAQLWQVQKMAEARVAEVEQSYSAQLAEAQAELEKRKQIDDAVTAVARLTAEEAQRAREDAFVASTTVNHRREAER